MTYHVEALGWTLIHFCWQAAAIAILYRATDAALARRSSHARYAVALAALFALLAVAVGTFAYEEARGAAPLPAISSADSAVADIAPAPAAMSLSAPSPADAPLQFGSQKLLLWIDALWVLGVLVLSGRALGGWWLIEKLRRSPLAQAPQAVAESFQNACRSLNLVKPVLLRISDRVVGPLTVGLFRPLVVLPLSAITALTPEQIEAVLAHELAHIRRKDYLWNVLQSVVETLFFFHPAVWWISRSVREQRELCCDDIALSVCSSPIVYADALFRLEEQRSRQLHLAMAFDGNQSPVGLRARVGRILGAPVRHHRRIPQPLLVFIALVGLAVLLPVSGVLARSQAKPSAEVAPWAEPARPPMPATPASTPVIASPEPMPAVEPAPAADPQPEAEPAEPQPVPSVSLRAQAAPAQPPAPAQPAPPAQSGVKIDYIEQMRAAGYDEDIDKYVAMKIHGITPEYARSVAQSRLGKPSADDLIAMKIHGMTADYLSKLQGSGFEPKSFGDAIAYQIFKISPEYVNGMKAAGFNSISSDKLIALRVQGITPEYARQIRQQFPSATADDLIQLRIFRIDDAFIAQAKKHGFDALSISKLVQLRISGLLGDGKSKEE